MKILIFIITLIVPVSAMSSIVNEDELSDLTKRVMTQIEKGNIEEGINLLRPHWKLPKHEIDGVIYNIGQQMPTISERFGKSLGFLSVCEQSISSIGKLFGYIQKFENHALVWIFVFYKPDDKWVFNTINFNDKWHELFGENCSK